MLVSRVSGDRKHRRAWLARSLRSGIIAGAVILALGGSAGAQSLNQPSRQGQGLTEEQFRAMLQDYARRQGFGGILRAPMESMLGGSSGTDECGQRYSKACAAKACRMGYHWDADRLQNGTASPSDRAWWGC